MIVVHCSCVRPYQTSSAAEIDKWHKEKGWKSIGYHFVCRRDGTIETGRPVEVMGAHCYPHNRHSIGVCYEGGLDARGKPYDTRTPQQKTALRALLKRLRRQFPKALIVGHRDLAPDRDCPCFDAIAEYRDLQP